MKPNQYQVVFLVTLLFLGYWVYSDLSTSAPRGQRSRGGELELTRYPAPQAEGLPATTEDVAQWPRDLFNPPRDTEPLAPLAFHLPPTEPLAVLAPPGSAGPHPAQLAPGLRRNPVVEDLPALFSEVALTDSELLPEELAQADLEATIDSAEDSLSGAIADLRNLDSEEAQSALRELEAALRDTSLEVEMGEPSQAEKIASYLKLYDSIQTPTQQFGRIVNKDRFGLALRPQEDILFVEVVPETGKERFPGQAPIPYPRSRVTEFQFADNPANQIELRRIELGDTITPAEQSKALALAQDCLTLHREAPRALSIARDLCRQVVALDQGQHLEGRLLLAELHEVNFEFDEAFAVYADLLDNSNYARNGDVLVAAGRLYERLGVLDRAEPLYRQALAEERSHAEAHLSLGELLLSTGRAPEALPHLAAAEENEPRGVPAKARRIAMRTAHGRALLALGQPAEASRAFQRALSLEEADPGALAGAIEAARLGAPAGRDAALQRAVQAVEDELVEADFALGLAQGLAQIDLGNWARAKRHLELAVEADPFRSHLALGALAYLAERTGHPDKALEYLGQALEVYPHFAWAHFTLGRVLLGQDDLEGAEASLRRALELELDFPDALVVMAQLERARSDFQAAHLYLERALSAEGDNPAWLTLAGFNAYDRGEADAAREFFQAALKADGDFAAAGLGEAWWHYMAQNSREAITRYGEWVDRRRNAGPEDPYVAYAEAQSARIVDHDSKELWTDRFERRPGRIGNGWSVKEGLGPTIELQDGAVRIEGLFTGTGRTRIYNELSADAFLSLEGTVTVGPEHRGCEVGFFLARERTGHGGDVVVQAEAIFQRNADGQYQYRIVRRGEQDAPAIDIPGATMPVGSVAVWSLEKVGVGSDAFLRLFVNGEPIVDRIPMPTLGTSTQVLRFGLYVEGQTNRTADVTLDTVRVVRRRVGS